MSGYDLERFVHAQESGSGSGSSATVYEQALAELTAGRKQSHWMWFVFPQLRALGRSPTAQYYGIGSADEASAYLGHPLLGPRLVRCSEALLGHENKSAELIMGHIDALKLRSSMTLFEAIGDRPQPFASVLASFYGGRDEQTLRLLHS